MAGKLNWFDMHLPFITATGQRVETNPLDITRDFASDPIVDIATRHPYVEIGFRYLMRDLLQIAMAPVDTGTWAERMEEPPSPEKLAASFAFYRRAFLLDDDTSPAMQVRPSERVRSEAKKKRKDSMTRRTVTPEEDDEENDDDSESARPISTLLPEAPTKNNLKNETDFFIKRDGVACIGAGAVLPVLYAHMVLFPQSGGGYFGLPHGPASIKFAVRGRTLWESIWANVAGATDDAGRPAPCDQTVFTWLDPTLREMTLGRKDDRARRLIKRTATHASFFPLPRRYLLLPSTSARCDLTDIEGPGFTHYERWPAGLQYEPENWAMPFVAERKVYAFGPNGWRQKTAAADSGQKAEGPTFLKAQGPLRFDDWLEMSLDGARELPERAKLGDQREQCQRPAIVLEFQRRANSLAEVQRSSTLAIDTGFRLEAIAAILDGKVMAVFSRRQLPLWHARDQTAATICYSSIEILDTLAAMAKALQGATKSACTTDSMKSPKLSENLRDALRADLDPELLGFRENAYEMYAKTADANAADRRLPDLRHALVKLARGRALALFDEIFPVTTLDAAMLRVLGARRKLVSTLNKLVAKARPLNETNSGASVARAPGKKGTQ